MSKSRQLFAEGLQVRFIWSDSTAVYKVLRSDASYDKEIFYDLKLISGKKDINLTDTPVNNPSELKSVASYCLTEVNKQTYINDFVWSVTDKESGKTFFTSDAKQADHWSKSDLYAVEIDLSRVPVENCGIWMIHSAVDSLSLR